jgi:hypothetical protein
MAYTTIDDPSAYFQTKLYTGNSTNNTAITNDGNSDLQPDWIWAKSRTNAHYHDLRDSSRGIDERLVSNTNDAESTKDQSYVSFDSDGFTLGDDTDGDGSALNTINTSSNNYVAWQWKANGGTTTTNDASATGVGTIDSVYQANTTAGFSIVTHTGSGSAGNIAHGLGAVPEWIVTKNRTDSGQSWANYHASVGAEYYLELDTTDAQETASSVWGDTTPSSTTFRVGGANGKNNASSKNYVTYCFTPIQGYSKFGSYTGNGNADGPFIYTGFKPTWLLIKNTTAGEGWFLHDATVDDATATGNPVERRFQVNESQAEVGTTNAFDFVSNGFKLRTDTGSHNNSGDSFIYMAFAESPFVSSEGVPTTAR